MFDLGDKVVYPMHGAGKIESVEEKEVLGELKKYYILKMPIGEIKLMIPVDNVNDIGLRSIIHKDMINDVMEVLNRKVEDDSANWNKRYRKNMEKMKTGDIFELADVVRDLFVRDKERGLSTGEKKMLVNAKQMLVSEIALSSEKEGSEITNYVNEYLEKII